jgi:hypothetical protein
VHCDSVRFRSNLRSGKGDFANWMGTFIIQTFVILVVYVST